MKYYTPSKAKIISTPKSKRKKNKYHAYKRVKQKKDIDKYL